VAVRGTFPGSVVGDAGGTMFRLRSLAVVVLLVASSVVTLKLMGWSQWVQAILVIAVELSLGVILHEIVEGSAQRARASRQRPSRRGPPASHRRKAPLPRVRPQAEPDCPPVGLPTTAYTPVCRLLLPVREDRPGLVEFAIRESRAHRAELDLLFVRLIAVLPMGPSSNPTEDEDDEAREVIARARKMADREGIPFRSLYQITSDPAATILELAAERDADLVVMPAPKRGGFIAKYTTRDDLQAVLKSLPRHIGLLVHA
jgi:hypothetical protein